MKKLSVFCGITGLAIVALSIALGKSVLAPIGQETNPGAVNPFKPAAEKAKAISHGSGAGMEAIKQAAQADKYLFAFFWKDDSDQIIAMKKQFEETTKKLDQRAQWVQVCVSDPDEQGIVEKYGLDRAPMPLVLVIAPNGAIMGGFPQKFTEQNLLNAFGTPCTERCMKALQEGKLIFLCVQYHATKSNEEALQGVRDFQADSRYASVTEIVMLDPSESAEAPFLSDLKIDPQTSQAVTAFMAPPGLVIAEFKGATDKAQLISALEKASSGCCPEGACGPNGCKPQN